ncbi:LOW QUALITY PROTEIN: Reverse transcriptase [Phytophthora palmivora]|uniref:Reverse transcriptase n=1 Tax=Phytophthora palmivora TaxID=4796 RepID=A0A2P4YU06_9STRA|nr:LOW QUALITY PROTEIN: Reverse transcriptase [Phytophthora palmivora]
MSACALYSALDLVDGYYQILMRESDIPLTAVSTPSGMLWEWLVMPQGLSNAPATFNRLKELFRPLRTFAQTYFDDIFVHSHAEDGQTAMEVHLKHLRRVFDVMRANKLYAKIDKCVFAAEEIKVLGCFVSRVGVRADPGNRMDVYDPEVAEGPPELGLANYLHKYSAGYAELARPLSDLLKKDADWVWEQQHQDAFDSIKASLQQAPGLALPDENKSFSVVCDASDYAIGCALLQKDDEGRERVISFQSRQLKAAERNYPVHDKELLAMKYALVKFRVHLLDTMPFVIYTDHASLRTATYSPHLSQRMARWLSFFAEYNFRVEYKPGKLNVLADALSRRPDYELAHVSRVTTDLYDRIRFAYQEDKN